MKEILFICLGNICRSPAAEGVMKKLVADAGKENEVKIDSAAIGPWHVGELPDSRMRKCGSKRGYNFNSRARQFSAEDFLRFDKILVMDQDNYKAVMHKAKSKEDKEKVEYLSNYLQEYEGVATIPDPYYGGEADFEYALDLIENACKGLMNKLD